MKNPKLVLAEGAYALVFSLEFTTKGFLVTCRRGVEGCFPSLEMFFDFLLSGLNCDIV